MLSFTFNGTNSRDFGIIIEESNIYTKGQKRIEFIEVPGRTGNLIVYDNSRRNIELSLLCTIEVEITDKKLLLEAMDEWLNNHEGYKDLVFSNGIAYKAVFTGELTLPTTDNFYTDFELIFSAYQE